MTTNRITRLRELLHLCQDDEYNYQQRVLALLRQSHNLHIYCNFQRSGACKSVCPLACDIVN